MYKNFMFGSTLCQLMEQLWSLTRNPLAFCFLLFILISYVPVNKKHKHFLVWEHVVSDREAATALNRENLSFFLFVYIDFISYFSLNA